MLLEEKDGLPNMNSLGKGKRFFLGFDRILGKIEEVIGITCFIGMIITILVGVFLRFVLRTPNRYGEEIAQLTLCVATYTGISMAIRSRNHLGVGMFVGALPKKVQKVISFLTSIVGCAVYAFITVTSFMLYNTSKGSIMGTPALELPYFYIYFTMGCLFSLSFLRSVMMFINDFVFKEKILPEKSGGIIE